MRILVTGAAGFIGSHVADRLLHDGHDVLGVDAYVPYYDRSIKERNLEGACSHPQFTFAERDLRSDALDDLVAGVDVVVHEAAMAGLMTSWSDLPTYASCNLVATQRLLDAATAAGVPRFVHASTSSVYGENAVGDEGLPTMPASPYGITKLAAEHLVRAAAMRHGIDAKILRYFSIYGPRQRPDMAYHIFTRALLDERPITVFGDGHQSRSNTYVDDCVDATVTVATTRVDGDLFNIGGGVEITLLEAIGIIAGELGVTPRIVHEPARPGDQRRTAAVVDRARAAFGYDPRVVPDVGLRREVAWLRDLAEAASRR